MTLVTESSWHKGILHKGIKLNKRRGQRVNERDNLRLCFIRLLQETIPAVLFHKTVTQSLRFIFFRSHLRESRAIFDKIDEFYLPGEGGGEKSGSTKPRQVCRR